MLLLEVFKEQPYIGRKLVKGKNVTTINIIICLNLTEKHNRGTINKDIWWQSNSSIFIIKNHDFEVKIIICTTKLVLYFVGFVKHDKFF